ncbi:MAG: 50S ribosomal protein L4 [Verrucomicrobiae bacterium]|nr:50S ribosomal protein L4 [Verrucomicrobiae bacterium]
MSATAFTIESAKSASFRVIEDDKGGQAVHDMVTAMRANRRSGTACTKTRTEVAGSGKKPWRQKGTGRARAGRITSPIWRGGGITFGPRPRSYAKSVNKRTKQLAFSKALSERILAGDVLTSDTFAIADGKTKSFVNEMSALGMPAKTLIISAAFDEKTYLAGRNVQKTLLMTAAEVNTEHLLYFDKIIITSDALQTLAARTGGNV